MDTESPEKEFISIKEQVMKLDEPRKKAFYRYYRWKNSLANDKNIKSEHSWKLMLDHNSEYQICCTIQEREEKPPLMRKSYSRIQSAKSGVSGVRQSQSNLKRMDDRKSQVYSTQKIQSNKKECIQQEPSQSEPTEIPTSQPLEKKEAVLNSSQSQVNRTSQFSNYVKSLENLQKS